jgi:hypothetical protein
MNVSISGQAHSPIMAVDGEDTQLSIALHRDGRADRWDFSVFLDVPIEVTAVRIAGRDGACPDPDNPSTRRYIGAQRIYFA